MNLLTSGKLCSDVNAILDGDQPAPTPPQPEPPEYDYCDLENIRILGIDDEGEDVAKLQGMLEQEGYDLEYCGGCDGVFGEGTEYAVKSFQKAMKLDVDGVVGKNTWEKLLRI